MRLGRIATGVIVGSVLITGAATLLQGSALGRHEAAMLSAVRQTAETTRADDSDYTKVAMVTSRLLAESHYTRKPVDAKTASQLFDNFLQSLDPQHFYFLQSDLQEFEPLRAPLADQVNRGDTSTANKLYDRFVQRFGQQTDYVRGLLKTETFTFTGNDSYDLDRKKAPYPANLDEAKALWRQELRYEYLQEKLQKKKPAEIVETLDRRYARLQRSLKESDADDVFELFLTTLTHVYDPHSDYFGKASADQFNIDLKLTLYGIGAKLQSEDGYAKIMELTPGGPALKSGKLKPGDRVVGVAQGESGELVDTVDMKLNKVVDMIRGPKGTSVRLTIIPADAPDPSVRKVVTLVRDQIKLEDQAAKARLIEVPTPSGRSARLGVIDLPSFYIDPRNGKSATADVAKLLAKLKRENVEGVVLDLRRNGGGSLPEAIALTGLFIKQGPVVQVRDSDGRTQIEYDTDSSVAYSGPLVVLISRFSASASEIVAGALQDYGRAVIAGDPSTFGKGTVQMLLEMDDTMRQAGIVTKENPGSLKLTIQKFYRPSGSSTQLKGVQSDIVIPSLESVLEVGESTLKNPLPWNTIPPVRYERDGRVATVLPELKTRASRRMATEKDMVFLAKEAARFKKSMADRTVSLNEEVRLKERADAQARIAARQKELSGRKPMGEKVYAISLADAANPGLPAPLKDDRALSADATARANALDDPDTDTDARPNDPAKKSIAERDMGLDEAKRILLDWLTIKK